VPEGVNNLYFTVARFLSNLTATNIKNALGITTLSGSNTGDQDLSVKQNILTNPLTGIGSELDPNTYALQDGAILYHSVKWFTPTSTVSTSGTTITSVGTQFTSAMVGAKLIINGEWRIITAYTSSTVVTVGVAFSTNYSGVVAGSWGVYSKAYEQIGGFQRFYDSTGVLVFRTSAGNNLEMSNGISSGTNAGFFSDNFSLRSDYRFLFSSTSSAFGTKDLGIRRNSAGVLEIYDGITTTGLETNRRDLLARNVTASQFKLNALNAAPASATATGVLGEIRYDANYMYVCTATNTWKRSALTTW